MALTLSEKIVELRQRRMTDTEIAEALDVSRIEVSRLRRLAGFKPFKRFKSGGYRRDHEPIPTTPWRPKLPDEAVISAAFAKHYPGQRFEDAEDLDTRPHRADDAGVRYLNRSSASRGQRRGDSGDKGALRLPWRGASGL